MKKEEKEKLQDQAIDDFQLLQEESNLTKIINYQHDLRNAGIVLGNWKHIVDNVTEHTDKTNKFKEGVFVVIKMFRNHQELFNNFADVEHKKTYYQTMWEMSKANEKDYNYIANLLIEKNKELRKLSEEIDKLKD